MEGADTTTRTKHCHATVVSLGRFYCDTSQAKFSFDTEDTGPAYTHPEISTSDKTHRRLVFPEIPSVLRRYVNTPTVCGVCCIAGYELRNSFGRSKWFRDSAGGCRLGKQPKRSAAELDQRRRRAAAPPPPCGCAGPSPGARARKRVVGFCAVLVAGCSLVVPVRVPVGVRGFWVTCEGPLSAPDAHAPAGGAHNGHQ